MKTVLQTAAGVVLGLLPSAAYAADEPATAAPAPAPAAAADEGDYGAPILVTARRRADIAATTQAFCGFSFAVGKAQHDGKHHHAQTGDPALELSHHLHRFFPPEA